MVRVRNVDWKQSEDQKYNGWNLKGVTKTFYFSGVVYLSKTTIKPVISRIRYFDTKLLNTDSIIVKVREISDNSGLCSSTQGHHKE